MPDPTLQPAVPSFGTAHLFINGRIERGRGPTFPVVCPFSGSTLLDLATADAGQIEAALQAARSSFDAGVWRQQSGEARGAVLDGIADRLAARLEDLAERVVFDNGKTLPEARIDVYAAVGAFRYGARCAREQAAMVPAEERGVHKEVWREPVGVVVALTPFNAPLLFTALKCAPALAAGNSVILKPSERAPLLPLAVFEAALDAGVPAGVLNLLHGGTDVAAQLCDDPRTDMITLTGGSPAGTAVMRAAAPRIKRLLLELGGKSPHIILADADIESAIPAIAAGIFRNSGQRCFSGSRLIVDESVADAVEDGVARFAESLVVGNPFDPGTQIGAMVDRVAIEQVEAFVARATADGLTVRAGGRRVAELRPGYFYRPTLLTGARADSWAAQTEIFGPVLTSIRVRGVDEAIAVANATDFGLAGGVWTRSPETARLVASRVRCGYFWVNTYGAIFGDMPFGGYGRSGLGRESGPWGYEAYTELKSVLMDPSGGSSAPLFVR